MRDDGQGIWWKVIDGWIPGCPVGTVVSLINEPELARVIRAGVGQVGTLEAATTTQTSTPDGTRINLVSSTEGWRAVLTRTPAPALPPPPPVAVAPAVRPANRLSNDRIAAIVIVILIVIAAIAAAAGPRNPPPATGLIATPATPRASFKPIKLAGKGSKVVRVTIPAGARAIATIANKGGDNFVVETLAADGTTSELLVKTIGGYAGTVLFDAGAGVHAVAFRVSSSSTWTIELAPVSSARTWTGSGSLSGTTDDVIVLSPPTAGLTAVTLTNGGPNNFIVQSYATDGSTDLVAKQVGSYSGQTTLHAGTDLLQVTADGAWTITINP
jgi:hypothetical protein